MPTALHLILYPGQRRPDPAPVELDLTIVCLIGIAAWVVALGVTLLRWRAGDVPITSAWTCAAGIALGIIGVGWARHLRSESSSSSAS